MNNQEVREIAETAFKARFSDIVRISVKPGFDYYDEPLVDVRIIYDGEVEQLGGEGILAVISDLVDKIWEAEDSPGWPQVHFISKSDLKEGEYTAFSTSHC